MQNAVVFLGRQPIFDRKRGIYGYELLYRREDSASAGSVGREQSAQTIVRAVSEIGLTKLVKDKPAFINVPSYLLADPCLTLLPPDRVVIEILEDTEPTPENLRAVADLASKGYRLALDDFVPGAPQEEFLRLCHIVKLDLPRIDVRRLGSDVLRLKRRGLLVLAEKVETDLAFGQCLRSHCDLFQGYFFARPELVGGQQLPASGSMLVRLMSVLNDPEASMSEVEELVAADVTLAYRLLKLVNSAGLSVKSVESVHAALLMLGVERVSALVSLLVMAGMGSGRSDLVTIAMIRAKMCEGVAKALGIRDTGTYFTVGLLSVLEAMFAMPMSELVSQLPLASALKDALVNPDESGSLGLSLKLAIGFEKGDWSVFEDLEDSQGEISDSYVAAVGWAMEAEKALAA